MWKIASAFAKSAEAKKCLSRSTLGTVAHAFETARKAGSNSLYRTAKASQSRRIQSTYLQGVHFICGLSAVNWMATDQLRFGSVRRSNVCSLSLMTPSGEAAARAANFSMGVCAAARQSGTAASTGSKCLRNIVDGEQAGLEVVGGIRGESTRCALASTFPHCSLRRRRRRRDDDGHDGHFFSLSCRMLSSFASFSHHRSFQPMSLCNTSRSTITISALHTT